MAKWGGSMSSGDQTQIAAFAVENDTLYAAALIGRSVQIGRREAIGKKFSYEEIVPPESIKLSSTLKDAEIRNEIGSYLRRINLKNPDVVGFSTYGAVNTEQNMFTYTPSDGDHINPIELNFSDILKPVIGNAHLTVENDTTAAAVGEYYWGAGRRPPDLTSAYRTAFTYVWVSRGVNAGIIVDGAPLAVKYRPEIGHLLAREPDLDGIADPIRKGSCSEHAKCITGMAGLKTMIARLAHPNLSDEQAIKIAADYVAQLCATVSYAVVPARIAIGGLQMYGPWGDALFEQIHQRYPAHVKGVPFLAETKDVIVRAELGILASLLGVAEIARKRAQPRLELEVDHA